MINLRQQAHIAIGYLRKNGDVRPFKYLTKEQQKEVGEIIYSLFTPEEIEDCEDNNNMYWNSNKWYWEM